ncbi:hypothetical protein CDFC105_42770 [Clostridioides difficile]|nr:hypothetical protein CDFC105_42770 [Clostridioides difficile]
MGTYVGGVVVGEEGVRKEECVVRCRVVVFFFKQKTAYEISACLVGSEMCIRDRVNIGLFILT